MNLLHQHLRQTGLLVTIALAATAIARADIIIEQDTLIANTRRTFGVGNYNDTYHVNDGVTLTFTGTQRTAGGVFNLSDGTALVLAPNPGEPLGTGRFVFRDIYNTTNGGAIYNNGGTLRITGAQFINIKLGSANWGGAIANNGTNSVLFINDSQFLGCSAGGGAALCNAGGTIVGSNLLFDGNFSYATTSNPGTGGAIRISNAGAAATLTDAVFINNRTRLDGGAIGVSNGDPILNNPVFTNNWAGQSGGALWVGAGRNVFFNITASGSVSDYLYFGNRAGGALASYDDVLNNAPPAAAFASGGFLYLAGVTTLHVGSGASLTIGVADATDKAVDSIAGDAAGQFIKNGAGDLVLNADNSGFRGVTNVNAGSLLLGNGGASLGGTITAASGVTFGGSGTVRSSTGASSLTLASGATLQIGLAGRAEESLSITGALTLNNATLAFVATGGTHATQLNIASTPTVSGATRVDLRLFTPGAYNLGALDGRLGAGVVFLANGADVSASTRQSITDVSGGGDLILAYTADHAREMLWAATGGGVWNTSAANANWADIGEPASGVNEFAGGDAVVFDNTGAGTPAAITLADRALVTVMTVNESGTLAFTGAGGITGGAYFQNDAADAAAARAGAGQLIKNDTGTLRFENTGGNTFAGGIVINDGGVIEFSNGGQLRAGAAAIVFNATGTLRATDDATLESNLSAKSGAAIVFDTSAGDITHNDGVISGAGVLRKQGAGMLTLNSTNLIAGVELAGGVLRAGHSGALGAGALQVTGGGATLELAGPVEIANAIHFAGRELSVRAAGAGGGIATLAGALTGDRLLVAPGAGVLGLSGANTLNAVTVQNGATAGILSNGALGGAAVRVLNGGVLAIGAVSASAGDTTIESGGVLAFNYLLARVTGPRLQVEGTLELQPDSIIALEKMPSAKILLATTSGDLIDSGATLVTQIGSGPVRLFVEGRDLYALNLNWDANPGKDVAAAFDALTALSDAIRARVSEGFLLPLAGRGNSLWLKTVGARARHDGSETKTGHRDETMGLVVGYDKMLGENFLAGGHAGYTYSQIKTDNRSQTDAHQPFAGLYASYKKGKFYVTADATAGSLDATTLREEGGYGNPVTGSYRAATLGAGAEAGAVLQLGAASTLRPFAAVHYLNYKFSRHIEFAPAGEGALLLDDFTTNHVESHLGARLARAFRTPWGLPGMVEVSAGWRRALHDNDASLGVTFANNHTEHVRIERAVYGRDRANVGAALRFALRKDMTAALAYDYEFCSGATRDTLAATIAWSW